MKIEEIQKYIPGVTLEEIEKYSNLTQLYRDWNEKINIISRKDMDQLVKQHIFHSLIIARFISFRPNATILDLGTGGGLPGLPLAIRFPETNFVLVDSIGKKIKVVEDIAIQLKLKNVSVVHGRAENIKDSFDFIVSRATASLEQLVQWTRGKFKKKHFHAYPNGLICLKGGDLSAEISLWKDSVIQLDINELINDLLYESKYVVYLSSEEY